MIKVSVIVPVYNASAYIGKCINSICQQSLLTEEYEVIVIDDGSTDDSLSILTELSKRYSNLLVFSQVNQGASAARNKGIELASGEYIGFVDADDWIDPNMYEKMYISAKEKNADIVFCNLYTNGEKSQPYLLSGTYEGIEIVESIYPRLICSCSKSGKEKTIRGAVWCKLFKRKLILDNKINFNENLIYNEDGLFCIDATLKSEIYTYMGEEYLYYHNIIGTSITKRYIDNLWERQKDFIPLVEACVKDLDYNFSSQIDKKMFEIAVYSIENEIKKNNQCSIILKIKHASNIINDSELQRRIKNIDVSSLNKIQKGYWLFLKWKVPVLALILAKYRYRNNKYM